MRTLAEWRRAARAFLAEAGVTSAAVEADWIARHALRLRRVDLTLSADRILTRAERRRLSRLLHRRGLRVPLQYVLGEVDFRGLTLRVTPAVLIPRPETEGLVDRVLEFLEPDAAASVLDVGTGSGAIALALARERPRLSLWATDISPAAVRLARANAKRLGLTGRVRFLVGDLTAPFEALGTRPPLRVLVSNPPYVSPADRDRLEPEVAGHEPRVALFAPEEGLAVIRRLVSAAARLLPAGALLALEIGEEQGKAVKAMLHPARRWERIRIERDLAGRVRYALALRGRAR